MFFFLSKILAFMFMPLTWVAAFTLIAFLSKDDTKRKKNIGVALLLLFFFSNSFILDEFMRAWEIEAIPDSSVNSYDAAIVLGGMSTYDEALKRVQFNRGTDRIMQAARLYREGKVKKIIFAGGSGSIDLQEIKEADNVVPFFVRLGIPESDILSENRSRNTHENAVEVKKLTDSLKIKGKFLLVTSGFHMRRSLACFENEGITADPFSTDRYSGPRKFAFDHLFLPSPDAFYNWNVLIHEWVGFAAYKIKGYL